MNKYTLLIAITILIAFNTQLHAQAIEVSQLFNIGTGKNYVCASDTVFGNFIGKKATETSASYFSYQRARRISFNKLNFFKRKKNSSESLSRRTLRRINLKIKNWKKTYRDLRRCWRYNDAFSVLSDNQDPDIQRACEIISPETNNLRTGAPISRIISGKRCDLNSSPIIALSMFSNRGNQGSCSGTAVTKRAIITAAHCLTGGVNTVRITSKNQTLESTEFYIHPAYNDNLEREFNDVAVILLDQDIATDIFKPIKDINLKQRELGIIAGYGFDDSFVLGRLIAAPVLVDSFTEQSISIRFTNNNDFGNTCNGDSGGPLMIKVNDTWRLVGVTSNGVLTTCGAGDLSRFANLLDPTNISFFETYIPDLY